MCVRHMGMRVAHRRVPMRMAVCASWHGLMRMQMVPVVMRVGMLMFQRLVLMFVAVRLKQMQHHAA